ncbi:biotin--[acetyl-CoA-carboxylase] ligase [Allostreptomyces psammosilenae]|uniref:biotin--[biotin carboxyl-carrier protein] ligase n=1 Tax=Allostreptomyces psammosilenae TaxID=1892865 RepID=A0A852ZZK6_9ACTN|nr:biotin--[acetyl-CoA-carboxylase] ligase [Allostreptomyces psammosilenae]NYI06124.1 BirA family biotin operon repressor/biotin-[acetyl-CoA-carboxylase] ligase [Allostreptomyces psammosilenae]
MTTPRTPWTDLERPPLDAAALNRALARDPANPWHDLEVLPVTDSTNAVLRARAAAGAPEGLVLLAEQQTAGRGRLGRAWTAPPRSGVFLSALLRPGARADRPDLDGSAATEPVPVDAWGWLPLLTGVAAAEAISATADRDVALKWPNDLLLRAPDGTERKLGGILVERHEDAVVVGIGVNVSLTADELPVPTATSLTLAGVPHPDRAPLVTALLRRLAGHYRQWRATGGDPAASGLIAAYTDRCATLGREVDVELPGGRRLTGTARRVDADGHLVVATPAGDHTVSAGDVVHVRAAGGGYSSPAGRPG